MNTIIVGGCAAGDVVDLQANATYVQLSKKLRPKVLAGPQAPVEFDEISDIYEIFVIQINVDDSNKPAGFGIGVVNGKTLVWGMQQLMLAYQRECKGIPKEAAV